jgi:four helix bundle protein
MSKPVFNLEERLLLYAARTIKLVDRLPHTRAANHISKQLLRSGTSALPNHGEAQAAESRADFVHKLQICLKELRESHRWLKLIKLTQLMKDLTEVDSLLDETDQLVRIFVRSLATARQNNRKSEL